MMIIGCHLERMEDMCRMTETGSRTFFTIEEVELKIAKLRVDRAAGCSEETREAIDVRIRYWETQISLKKQAEALKKQVAQCTCCCPVHGSDVARARHWKD